VERTLAWFSRFRRLRVRHERRTDIHQAFLVSASPGPYAAQLDVFRKAQGMSSWIRLFG
jgi:hypothetical protein